MKMEARVCEDTGFFYYFYTKMRYANLYNFKKEPDKAPLLCFSPSARTRSPLGSDCESEAFGLIATIITQGCSIITLGYFSLSVPY